jgi:uncharacterized protein (TIGR03435 family)
LWACGFVSVVIFWFFVAAAPSDAPTTAPDLLGRTALMALRDQLGLKLEPARGPVKILVIDKVERPSEN